MLDSVVAAQVDRAAAPSIGAKRVHIVLRRDRLVTVVVFVVFLVGAFSAVAALGPAGDSGLAATSTATSPTPDAHHRERADVGVPRDDTHDDGVSTIVIKVDDKLRFAKVVSRYDPHPHDEALLPGSPSLPAEVCIVTAGEAPDRCFRDTDTKRTILSFTVRPLCFPLFACTPALNPPPPPRLTPFLRPLFPANT